MAKFRIKKRVLSFKKIFLFLGSFSVLAFSVFLFMKLTVRADSSFSFDEGSGAIVHDSTGHQSLTINQPAWKSGSECVSGSCLFFNGSVYVSFYDNGSSDAYDFAASDNFTLVARFRHTGYANGIQVILAKGEASLGYKLYADATGHIIFGISDTNNIFPRDSVITTKTYFDNLWHTVAAVKTGTTRMDLYVDGKADGIPDTDILSTGTLANSERLFIGSDNNVSGNNWAGYLDEIQIIRSAKTTTQIKNYNIPGTVLSASGTSATFGQNYLDLSRGLIGWWKLDESGGGPNDSSGNYLTLTNSGTTTFVAGKYGNGSEHVPASSQYFYESSSYTQIFTFDASQSGPGDPNEVWTDDTLAFDQFTGTSATSYTSGSIYTLSATGTNAPSTGGTISSVAVNLYAGSDWEYCQAQVYADVYYNSQPLGTVSNNYPYASTDWASQSLSTPSGGWTWPKIQALSVQAFGNDPGGTCEPIVAMAVGKITVSVTTEVVPQDTKTVSFWVNPDNTTNYYISLTASANITSSSGTLSTSGLSNAKIYVNGIESTSIVADQWQMVTVTYDSLTADQFYLGRVGSNYFDGTFDEVRLYNRTLSPAEIRQLYAWAPGPAGWWKMDENRSSTTADVSGNGYTGTLGASTAAPAWTPATYGSGLKFDGVNDYLDVAGTAKWNSLENLTVSFWLKPGPIQYNNGWILGKAFSTSDQWGVRITNSNYLQIYNDIDNAGDGTSCQLLITPDTWYHVTATMASNGDGTYANQMYINGVSRNCTGNSTGGWNSFGGTLVIGARYSGDAWFSGIVDDLRLYDYVRTPAQIVSDMNADHPAPGSPIGYWNFDQGYGTTANDSGTGARNGTLSTNASWSSSGKLNRAVSFNGVGTDAAASRISLPNDAYDTLSVGTIAFWFKPTDTGDDIQEIFTATDGTAAFTNCYEVNYVRSGNTINLWVEVAGVDTLDVNFPVPDPQTNWHHVAVTVSGSGHMVYIDGIKSPGTYSTGTAATTAFLATISTGTTYYTLGCGRDNTACYESEMYEGLLDELRLYPYPLDENEVKLPYNLGQTSVLGSTSTASDGATADNSTQREYCPPGNTEGNCAAGQNPIPVVDLPLDENSGTTTTNDISGNGYTGTFSNMPQTGWVSGKFGSAVAFNGVNSAPRKIQFASNAFNSLTQGTISFWFKLNNSGDDWQDLFAVGPTTAAGGWYELAYERSSGYLYADMNNGCSSGGFSFYTPLANPTTWHHLSLTVSAAGNALYLDGVRTTPTYYDSTSSAGDCFFSKFESTRNRAYAIGCFVDFNNPNCFQSELLEGAIDAFRIYDYVRTPAQIAWDYNKGAPLGHFKFDDGSGTTAYNAATTANDAAIGLNGTLDPGDATGTNDTVTDMWTGGATGKLNGALEFDGTNDVVTAGTSDTYNITGDLSLSAWIYPNSFGEGGYGRITERYSSPNGYRFFISDTSDNLSFIAAGTQTWSEPNSIVTGRWQHVTVTVTGTTVKFYVDGKLNHTDTLGGPISSAAGLTLYIGNSSTNAQTFDGLIDDLKIFNYVLTPAQVQLLYSGGVAVQL